MTKNEFVFMSDYGVKEMEFYCANDDRYEARFVDENGAIFTYNASRAKVMEHVKMFAAHPERYETNKDLVVSHFHAMARAFYTMAHLPQD
jgi:hypothetical protein